VLPSIDDSAAYAGLRFQSGDCEPILSSARDSPRPLDIRKDDTAGRADILDLALFADRVLAGRV
jgi:hypothetical protein